MSWLALKRFVVCVGMLACFQVSTPAFARPVQVMLDDEVTPPFEPENTFFLLELPGQEVQRVRAVAVSPFTSADGRGRSWTVGAEITIPEELKEFRYSILVLGPAQQFFVVPERTWSGVLPSIEQLRALLNFADRPAEAVVQHGNDQHAASNRPGTAADAGTVVVLQVRAQCHRTKQQQQATGKIDDICDKRSDCRYHFHIGFLLSVYVSDSSSSSSMLLISCRKKDHSRPLKWT